MKMSIRKTVVDLQTSPKVTARILKLALLCIEVAEVIKPFWLRRIEFEGLPIECFGFDQVSAPVKKVSKIGHRRRKLRVELESLPITALRFFIGRTIFIEAATFEIELNRSATVLFMVRNLKLANHRFADFADFEVENKLSRRWVKGSVLISHQHRAPFGDHAQFRERTRNLRKGFSDRIDASPNLTR